MTTQEAADYLDRDKSFILRLIREKRLPAQPVGGGGKRVGQWLIRKSDLDKLTLRGPGNPGKLSKRKRESLANSQEPGAMAARKAGVSRSLISRIRNGER